MVKYTLKLWWEHIKIFKVFLVIFQQLYSQRSAKSFDVYFQIATDYRNKKVNTISTSLMLPNLKIEKSTSTSTGGPE